MSSHNGCVFLLLGVDPLIWQQAILDNPDPDKYLPVPMVGFAELYKRLKQQESQTKRHQTKLNVDPILYIHA